MTTASLTGSLLVRKGSAKPAPLLPGSFTVYDGSPTDGEAAYRKPSKNNIESWERPEKKLTQPERPAAQAKMVGYDLKPDHKGKTIRKTVAIPADIDKELRVLAAARGVTQQQVLAEILTDHLHHIYAEEGCICGAKHHS